MTAWQPRQVDSLALVHMSKVKCELVLVVVLDFSLLSPTHTNTYTHIHREKGECVASGFMSCRMSSASFLNNFINFITYMARVRRVCVCEGHTQCEREFKAN